MAREVLERRGLDFTRHQCCAECGAEPIPILAHEHPGECSDDEAEAQGDPVTLPMPHGTVEWQSINVALDLS